MKFLSFLLRTIFSFLAWIALPYFSTSYHMRHNLGGGLLNIKCVLYETFPLLRIKWDIIIIDHRSLYKVPVSLLRFQ